MSRRNLVISPCRDEEDFVALTLESVIAQTERPSLWIIVDDGSTDGTPEIIAQAAAKHSWITVITSPPRSLRVLGSGVVHAFNSGLATVDIDDYDFVSKLDVDLILPLTYYEQLMDEMEHDPRLGTASGRPHVALLGDLRGDDWTAERGASAISAGMAKLYRVSTFKEIGGLVPEIMWDGIDCHEARIRGWRSRSFDSTRTDFKHLRPEGESERGVRRGRRRHGYGQWFMGTDPLFMLASALIRLRDDPVVTGSANMLAGYATASFRRVEQHGDRQFRADLRRFQRESLVLGKSRANRRWEERTAPRWYARRPKRSVAYLASQYPAMSHTFIGNEIRSLEAEGWSVVPFSARRGDGADHHDVVVLQETPPLRALADLVALGLRPRAALSLLAEAVGHGPPWPLHPIGLAYLLQAAVLVREMDRQNLTHVHVHFANNAAEIARLAQRIDRGRAEASRGLTWSLTVHGLWMHGFGSNDGPGFPDRGADRWGPLAGKLRSADAVFCVDEAARVQLAELAGPGAPRPVQTIHMGVDVEHFSPNAHPSRAGFTVLFVGRLAPEKSLETLVEGFAAMTISGARRLVIVGEGPDEDALRQTVKDRGVEHLVEILPRTSQEHLPAVYQAADVFAMTSLSEGIPVVLMEAMACGLPVVATDVGGIPELVESEWSGILVSPRDPAAVAAALDRLARDPAQRAELGHRGRQTVLRAFDARKNATGLSAVLGELIVGADKPGPTPALSAADRIATHHQHLV